MRGRINWTFKRIIGTIFGILGIGTLTSCYGVAEDDEYSSVHGTVRGKIDGNEQPIEGIEVALRGTNIYGDSVARSSSTNRYGNYYLFDIDEGKYSLNFIDVDGSENGSFKSTKKEIEIKFSSDYIEQNITLENDE